MKRIQLFPIAIVAIVLLLGVFGCSKQQDRYQDPPWLGGSSIETLQKKGNYTIFLKLMDLSEYTIPITKQLFTLFAPNDDAFKAYFQANGIQSVESLTKDQAVQLFTLHVLPNPRSRFQLIYEYVWSELQGPDGEYAALFFRKPTNSISLPYSETARYDTPSTKKGQQFIMSTGRKLVPLFSSDYFEDFFGAKDGSDYTFMYPDSKWLGNMNWGNAAVTESEVRTSSGFIYFVDQVVPPQKNIEEYLIANPDKFGLYYDILQRFANYNSSITVDKKVYTTKSYDLVSNIAEEQGAFTGNEVRMKDMFTAFLPSNEVLSKYLNEKILNTYASLDDVPKVTLYYILQTQLSRSLGLISKISQSYFNSFGDPMIISKSDIKSAHMCSNGLIYEMNRVLEPNVFKCVPGTLFFDANYSTFLYAMNQSNLLSGLANSNSKVTLFAPSNAQLEAYGIRYDPVSSSIMYKGKDTKWNKMKTEDMNIFVQDQIYEGELSDLNTDRYLEMSSGNFVHVSNGIVQGSENQRVRDKVNIQKTIIPEQNNGILYEVDKPIKSKWTFGKALVADKELSKFKNLLVWTKMLDDRYLDQTTRDTLPNLKFLAESQYWTGFIPTNAAIDKAVAAGELKNFTRISDVTSMSQADQQALKDFITYHFLRKSVVFDDGVLSGDLSSQKVESSTPAGGTVYSTLKITNSPGNLSITDHSGRTVVVDHAKADILVRKGVIHKIGTILKY